MFLMRSPSRLHERCPTMMSIAPTLESHVFFDPLYILVIIATLVVSGGAQLYIRSTYGRWSRVANGAGLSGAAGRRVPA